MVTKGKANVLLAVLLLNFAFHPDDLFTITTLQSLNPTVPLFAILCYILFIRYKTHRDTNREWETFNQHVFELLKTNQRTVLSSQFLLAASLIYFHIFITCKGCRCSRYAGTAGSGRCSPWWWWPNTPAGPLVCSRVYSPCKEVRLDYVQVLSQMFCTILFLYLQLSRNIVEDRRIIRKSRTNLSRGIANLFVSLIKDIVGEEDRRGEFQSRVQSYIASECLTGEGTVVMKKLFILFPESEEFDPRVEEEILRCTTQFLRSIERHPEEAHSVSIRPLIGERVIGQQELLGIRSRSDWLVDVLRLQKEGNESSNSNPTWQNIYLFSLENRPLRTLYFMRNDGHFDKDDFTFHFQLYLESVRELIKEDPLLRDTVEVVYYKDDSDAGEFTKHMFRHLEQAHQI